jgi:hypothetical protein
LRGFIVVTFLVGCSAMHSGCTMGNRDYPESFYLSIKNPAPIDREDEAIILNVPEIKLKHEDLNPDAFIVLSEGIELASQADDLDDDGNMDQIVFVADFKANQEKKFTIRYAKQGSRVKEYPKRTQAELSHKFDGQFVNRKYVGGTFQNVKSLRVPPEHTDHSFYIRYEGPGWESDKVGYRFYLDWRNAIDLFGKKTPGMVLQNVGLDGFDSYHEMSDWGMDILKVGEALGIGSIAMWVENHAQRVSQVDSTTCTVTANGPVFSQIRTDYFGWQAGSGKYDLVSELSITAGSRLTWHTLHTSGEPPNLCTGIVKLDSTQVWMAPEQAGDWTYLATYGKQSLANDSLGMAVLVRKKDLVRTAEDSHSHVLILKPENGVLTYCFLGAWEKEPDGITNKKAFAVYLDDVLHRLNKPVLVE